MQWNLRLRAAERGIWKSAQMRRMLADAGLDISAGKMSSWWAATPPSIRLDELDVLCSVLECGPNDLLTPEPGKVAARRDATFEAATGSLGGESSSGDGASRVVAPRFNKPRSTPPL
ncbi:MAG: helix-turn-helix transcriptional regulator [Nigerium sp.]|nr:helix-turn-helix transcriptional regulator [Nigerium sp.]MBK8463959.1 helix-turn-helix transcriptional regulator [Nigerium sp.]